jgi:hypothetical protein
MPASAARMARAATASLAWPSAAPKLGGDGPRVVKADATGGGITGQQGGDRVAGPGRIQQFGDIPRIVKADVSGGIAGQQDGDRVAGPSGTTLTREWP